MHFSKRSIDIDKTIINAANYIVHTQADINEDNAGNGDPNILEDSNECGWECIRYIWKQMMYDIKLL